MNKKYKYEHELCEAFINNLSDKWDVYPECYGWDMLLVNVIDGYQAGVQAKLKENIYVIYQALTLLNDYYNHARKIGPDYAIILTPSVGLDFRTVCEKCGLINCNQNYNLDLLLPMHNKLLFQQQYEVPKFKLQSKCGVSSPRRMSKWRENALNIMLEYDKKGYVTSADFKKLSLSHSLMSTEFFRPNENREKDGKLLKYFLIEEKSLIKGYEAEYSEFKEKMLNI